MTGPDDWATPAVDTERPSAARVYDYFLGGAHNFEVDRMVAERVLAQYPVAPQMAQVNRAFLRRAVLFLVEAGVRQFIDLGSGIPTVGNVHEIAQFAAPDARVVYVDIDPVAVDHSRTILAGNDRTAVIQEDVRRPAHIMRHPDVGALLDVAEPVAVLAFAVFHFISDADDPAGILARLTDQLASDSYLALSHVTADGFEEDAEDPYRGSGIEVTVRSRDEVEALFTGYELVEPGVVWAPQWRPESPDDLLVSEPEVAGSYAGVARKP